MATLRSNAALPDGAEQIRLLVDARAGELGIDYRTRNYFVLDGETGEFLAGSTDASELPREQTANLLTARNAVAQGDGTLVGDESDITAGFMDVAIPILAGDNTFIIYVLDNKDTVSGLNSQLFLIIMQALIIGLLISVLLSFLLSKTMVGPIEKLTASAEKVAAGDFDSKLPVESTDEIGILTGTFNEMAGVLESTLAAVENERNKLDTLFLHMTDGVVAFDHEGNLIHCNPAATAMLQRTVPTDSTYDQLFGSVYPFQEMLALQRPNYAEGEMVVGDRTLELYLAPFSDQASGGVLIVLHDITEQHRNEERRKEFVANVSHELRTPLTNVRSYAETLRDGGGDIPQDTANSFLDIIITETDRMTHIVQDLLTLSRLDAGNAELVLSRFPFGDAIESVTRANALAAKQRLPHPHLRPAGEPAPDRGRPQPAGAGDDEHHQQRHQIHPQRRAHRHHRRLHGIGGVDGGMRRRHRHSGKGPGPDLRTVLPGGQGPVPGIRRHRLGSVHRQGDCPAASRYHRPGPPPGPRYHRAADAAHRRPPAPAQLICLFHQRGGAPYGIPPPWSSRHLAEYCHCGAVSVCGAVVCPVSDL